jgi:hypothetical protein
MRKAGYDDRSVRLDSVEQGVLKLLEVGAANVLKDRLVGFWITADPIRGLLDPFEELRAQACASGFEKLKGLLNVALRRGAEPDRDHGTGRRSRIRCFTIGQGSDGSSRAKRSRRICSTSGEIGTFASASSAPGRVGWVGAGLGVIGSDYASGAGRASACAWRIPNSLAFLGFRQLVTMGAMRDLAVLFLHLLATVARLAGPGGARAVVAESVLIKQQLLTLNRSRKRSPNLRLADRFVAGLCTLLIRPGRLVRSAIVLRPSTLLRLHRALIGRKYRRLFSATVPTKPGPKGPSQEVIAAVVEMKRRNPTWVARGSRNRSPWLSGFR